MYIQLNGQVLLYEKTGEGAPLILLHGNDESHEIFDELCRELSDTFTVYAIDSRGQGGSATPKEYHYSDMKDDVYHFIRALEIEKPVVCGYSDGGIVALLLAVANSELLSSIIVCGANLTPKGLTASCRHNIRRLYKKTSSPLVKMMLEEPNISADDLSAITVPTLVCVGSEDIVKPKETQTILSAIPNATLHTFEGHTHGSYVKHSALLAPVILEFTK